MRIVIFCHSVLSDWNHGNAHFLRGIATELAARGHDVRTYEPRDAWSVASLVRDHGERPLDAARAAFPALRPVRYDPQALDLAGALDDADVVLVHEWNEPGLVAEIGRRRKAGGSFVLLFHDTHHRVASDPDAITRLDLSGYDAVLAFGAALRDVYLERGLARRAFAWHEAADTRVFRPLRGVAREGDVVFVGNWGDEERTAELEEYLLEPARSLGLRAKVYGVRYPEAARRALASAGVEYGGWVPNHVVPRVFAAFGATVHVPRRPYATALPGIPTIRTFEALACGIPLVCAPWSDAEGLFTPGRDFLVARDGGEMKRMLRQVLVDRGFAEAMTARGRRTVLARHTCRHRAGELLEVVALLDPEREVAVA